MSRENIIFIVILVALVVLIVITLKSNRTRKFKVKLADDSIMEVTRNRWDVLEDEKDMKCYHKADGKKIWFSNHFTIMKEEL
jgi:uncharacterized membrane protein